MKRLSILIIALTFLAPSLSFADSFSSLWKRENAAAQKDLPKKQIELLSHIITKAKAEQSYGNLLKAQLRMVNAKTAISPDSLKPEVARLESLAAKAEHSNPVLAAIYQSVLGGVYGLPAALCDDQAAVSKSYYEKSLKHKDLLAKAYATGYAPFVADGVDSRVFGDDLLHVLGMRAGAFDMLRDYYKAHGNRAATCLSTLMMLKKSRDYDVTRMKKSKYLQAIDSLLKSCQDLPVAGEVAIERYDVMEKSEDVSEKDKVDFIDYALVKWGQWPRMSVLRNAKKRLTLPSFHVIMGKNGITPYTKRKVLVVSLCNVNMLNMAINRVNVDGDTQLDPDQEKDYAKLKRLIVPGTLKTQTKRYIGLPDYKVVRDSMEMPGLAPGVYLVEFSTDDTSMPVERGLVRVSNVFAMTEALPGDKTRMAVVDATTGMPLKGAKVKLTTKTAYGKETKAKVLTCDSLGEVTIPWRDGQNVEYHAFTATDKASGTGSLTRRFMNYDIANSSNRNARIYTDRSIYRPGQTVHAAALAFRSDKDGNASALANEKITLSLRDANNKTIAEKTVVTDKWGSASVDFALTQSGLTGMFSIRSDVQPYSRAYFSVEEYKRPTFQVEFDKVETKYANGDTLTIKGTAKSFAGVAVQGARVCYKVTRRPSWWWRYSSAKDSQRLIATDTVATDGNGAFAVRVPMVMPEAYEQGLRRYYTFDIVADVTDMAGETRHGETSLPLSDRPTVFTTDMPDKAERDSLTAFTFNYKNNAGENIDGDVRYSIDGEWRSCKANTPVKFDPSGLKSMKHKLEAICGNDTLKHDFITFTMQDKKAVVETHDWFYVSGDRFRNDNKPVYVQLGSSDSIQHVVYTVISGDKILENGTFDLNDGELSTRSLLYRKEYGDGIRMTFAWVKEGQLFKHTLSIAKPQPDRRLVISWKTFRDRLVPGKKEEWTLNVCRPDKKPVAAQLMATMFDKSLDDLRKHSWSFGIPSYSNIPYASWNEKWSSTIDLYGESPIKLFNERGLDFCHFSDDIYSNVPYNERHSMVLSRTGRMPKIYMAKELSSNAKPKANQADGVYLSENEVKVVGDVGNYNEKGSGSEEAEKPEKATNDVQLRENLNETALFYPNLETDNDGNVKIKFTLPESITTWRFIGLAHDSAFNSGTIEGISVAKKTVMVQPNVPRFLRGEDKGSISARIFNTSENAAKGTAKMSLIDPETNKTVYNLSKKFNIEAGQSAAVDFGFDMNSVKHNGILICRVTASGKGFSDGEQHYIPVLPNKELVTNTLAFSQDRTGTKKINIDSLFAVKDESNKLTIEYTNNPAWLMVQALPSVAQPNSKGAMSLAAAYYANVIGRNIMQQSPAIKQVVELWKQENGENQSLLSSLEKNTELKNIVLNETPWLLDADKESDQKQMLANFFDETTMDYRINSIINDLRKLQNADGSFSWWPGMKGNMFLTTDISMTLARLDKMVGKQEATNDILSSAYKFMANEISDEVKMLKKASKEGKVKVHPSEAAMRYLYICSIGNPELTSSNRADNQYLLSLLKDESKEYSIYGKALMAIVFAKNGNKAKATELLSSLKQYTVYKEGMGRYFDTPKASYSWFDYRIPTEVASIEALKELAPDDKQLIGEMQQWLLQSKRTQAWSSPMNSVDAIYAFLDGRTSVLAESNRQPSVIKLNGAKLDMPKATAGLGYVKVAKTGKNFHALTVEKSSEGTSWGAVYAQFMQNTADVAAASSGITVSRELFSDGKKLSPANNELKTGDKVTVRITLVADRDYDFVQVSDKRAACMEPASQLSGYRMGYYCSPKDNVTNYYFDRLAKGKHTIETTYYIDRSGRYATGTCTAQCAYSPEFSARDTAIMLEIK